MTLTFYCHDPGYRMRTLLLTMTGVGFTLGVVFGLLLQLPIDNTFPADSSGFKSNRLSIISTFRSRRSLSEEKLMKLQQDQKPRTSASPTIYSDNVVFVRKTATNDHVSLPERNHSRTSDIHVFKSQHNGFISETEGTMLQRSTNTAKASQLRYKRRFNPETLSREGKSAKYFMQDQTNVRDLDTPIKNVSIRSNISSNVKIIINSRRFIRTDKVEILKNASIYSLEDSLYMSSIVHGILWTTQLENSCPKPFKSTDSGVWRTRVEGMDVVKMEEGCGRMQNRMVTFRDSSKACVRYRLNTDQIQGEIYSYYLARLLNITNIPPTMLARIETLSPKWRTVHLQMSLAQWADSKLVVLTEYIDGLSPAHIPFEFREEGNRLDPTLQILVSKSHSELCELLQWSDLIVFDYLTANLDRVINNMFNRQWNDQMMSSPAHNLEQQRNGGLVFFDNESGLFHGYRLLDKYTTFHKSLLRALCIFRQSTVEIIKRLHISSNIGEELHKLFTSNEVLHKHLPTITSKNVKILEQRIHDVHQQITNCENVFNR